MKSRNAIKDIVNIIKEQQSKSILLLVCPMFQHQKELHQSIDALKQELHQRMQGIQVKEQMLDDFLENFQEIQYDTIIVMNLNSEAYHTQMAVALLQELTLFVNHSVVVMDTLYYHPNHERATMMNGERCLYPTLFQAFDFSYKVYEDETQVYNFFPLTQEPPLRQDQMMGEPLAITPMKIAYVLPHANLTGGLKYLLSHAKHLAKRGHQVYVISKEPEVIPSWSDVQEHEVTKTIMVSAGEDLTTYLKQYDIDVVVVGLHNQIKELEVSKLPILYWEQGSESLYGEHMELLASTHLVRKELKSVYRKPIYVAAVSPIVQTILKAKYGREAALLYTGIDTQMYQPQEKVKREVPIILLVGNPYLRFKGFSMVLTALMTLWNQGVRFEVKWATQAEAVFGQNIPFPLKQYVLPSQETLVDLYAQADLFISGSEYESFPMPPIEAMACGSAVVSSDNGGIHVYAKPGENLILADQGNFQDFVYGLRLAIEDRQVRTHLVNHGLESAQAFSVEKAIDQLEGLLMNIIHTEERNKISDAQIQALYERMEQEGEAFSEQVLMQEHQLHQILKLPYQEAIAQANRFAFMPRSLWLLKAIINEQHEKRSQAAYYYHRAGLEDKSQQLMQRQEKELYPAVNIFIPTYNQQVYLQKAIESALAQNYPNYQVYVFDDGSTDETQAYCRSIEAQNFHYIRNVQNLGAQKNIETNFYQYSDAPYSLVMDHDDYLLDPQYLLKVMDLYMDYEKLSLVWANCLIVNQDEQIIDRTSYFIEPSTKGIDYLFHYGKSEYPQPFSLLTLVFKTEPLKSVNIFKEQTDCLDLMLKLKAMMVGDIGFIPEVVGAYRMHEASISYNLSLRSDEGMIEEIKQLTKLVEALEEDQEKVMKWKYSRLFNHFAWRVTTLKQMKQQTQLHQLLKMIKKNEPLLYTLIMEHKEQL